MANWQRSPHGFDLWNLAHTFAADISFRTDDLVHGVRKNNRPLMAEYYRIGYRGKDLLALNIVRHYRKLLHLSDISKCDGCVTTQEKSDSEVNVVSKRDKAEVDFVGKL